MKISCSWHWYLFEIAKKNFFRTSQFVFKSRYQLLFKLVCSKCICSIEYMQYEISRFDHANRVFLCQKKKTDFYACKGYVLFKFYCVHSVFFIESNITFVLTTILENHKKDRSRKNLSYNLFFPVPLLRPITLAMFFYSIALLNIHDYPIILHVDQKIVMKV